jgi:hypothetical protein
MFIKPDNKKTVNVFDKGASKLVLLISLTLHHLICLCETNIFSQSPEIRFLLVRECKQQLWL